MQIKLNGKSFTTGAANVAALVAELELAPSQIAIEQAGAIVPRSRWEQQAVVEGDVIEVVRLVGGDDSGYFFYRRSTIHFPPPRWHRQI
jgi:thiamine biosynthesis protein ThiS